MWDTSFSSEKLFFFVLQLVLQSFFFSSYGLQWWWCVCGVWVWRTYLSREHFFSFRISKFSFLFNFLALFSVFVVVGAATVGYRFRWLACKMSWLLLFFHRIYYFLRIILLDSLVFWCVTSMLVRALCAFYILLLLTFQLEVHELLSQTSFILDTLGKWELY